MVNKIERDERGLIKGINYEFNSDGTVNWRAMVPDEFFYVNPQKKEEVEKQYGKPASELKPNDIDDKYLVINLPGIRYLASLRGYRKMSSQLGNSNNSEYASVNVNIEFIPIFESECESYSDNACAHLGNTRGFGQRYLVELATNRAFCRTIRNYLRIAIVSSEELGDKDVSFTEVKNPDAEQVPIDLYKKAKDKILSLGFKSFAEVQTALSDTNNSSWANYTRTAEIPSDQIYMFITDLHTLSPKK